jgi:hypothetical protein
MVLSPVSYLQSTVQSEGVSIAIIEFFIGFLPEIWGSSPNFIWSI